jgi:tetratricopeptide (TPR) repeat protein
VLSAWRRAGGAADRELAAADALTLSRELGAGRLLEGSLVGSRGRLTLSASLLTVPRGAPVAQATVEGSEDSLAPLLDRLTAKLLTAEAGSAAIATSALSTSLPALQAYLDGVAAYRRGRYVDAGQAFDRALEFDSTFADAAFMLQETAGWEDVPGVERANRVLRGFQDRLSPRSRALLLASNGPRFPRPPSGAEMITAAERAVAAYPDQPDAWYHLGDWYFHLGDALGVPDASARALAAFKRAMSLDPDFSGPREHLIELYAAQRDTVALQGLERQLGADETREGRRPYLLWRITAAIGDSAARAERRATLNSLPPRELVIALGLVDHDALDQADADTLLAVMERRATTRDTRVLAAFHGIVTNLARGRPGAALQAKAREARERGNQDAADREAVFHALYADGDTLDAARAVGRLISRTEDRPARDAGGRAGQYSAGCWVEQWRLAHGDSRTAPRAAARLRQAAAPSDSATTVEEAQLCAALLEAWATTLARRPGAGPARLRLDSLMRTAPAVELPYSGAVPANQALARLFAAAGDTSLALAAIRRRMRLVGWDPSTGTALRLEGQLAAAVGDTAGSIRAYRDYLALRARPEAVLVPQRDSVRSELGVLEHGVVPREPPR